MKSKQLTNFRATGKDDAIRLTPPKPMTLEQAIAYIDDDEMVEVTPKSIRLRKALLDPHERKKADNLHEFLPAEESCFPIVGWRAAFGSAACGGRALSFLGRGLYALGLFCYGGDMTGTDLLFVYGTLRRGCGSVEAQRLHAQATWLGQGRVRGRLYRVDWYPALVACRSGGDEVTGDIYRLNDPDAAFVWLDHYEECGPGFAAPQEYQRVIAQVESGSRVAQERAWVYL
ncbi:MAG: gamma-glutamylcyclotransferase [Sphingobium sp.]|jgi:gamma-glutamylcyclotransferase (GGCT)/AIG2-like uncharacterized protein YtfP|nr:gamma-glutamylcyclotransferase [Sphingobium sp.]